MPACKNRLVSLAVSYLIVITTPVALVQTTALGDVQLPSVFSDHMVLQRDLPIPIWGMASPGEEIQVLFAGYEKETIADKEGKWSITLDPLPASSESRSLIVKGNNLIECNDVLVGEVWVCGGQSNMEWTVNSSSNPDQERNDAERPNIRVIKAPHITSSSPEFTIDAKWQICSPETVGNFTAVGFAFGRKLQDELKVPIGLLSINWGGTRIEPWISRRSLSELPRSKANMISLGRMQDRFNALSAEEKEFQFKERLAQHSRVSAGYLDKQFLNDIGCKNKWFSSNIDTREWDSVTLPKSWKSTSDGLSNFDGGIWYRRSIDLPEEWAGLDLIVELGQIDDSDIVWTNGVRIGSTTEDWTKRRRYKVNSALIKNNLLNIAILNIDSGGVGGLVGPTQAMFIRPFKERANAPKRISLSGNWRWKKGSPHSGPRPSPPPRDFVEPGTRPTDYAALHNGMVAPFTPYALRGAIWYQGESNSGDPEGYRDFLPALIRDWKREFERDSFPFGVVQLAAFMPAAPDEPAQGGWALLREAQSHTARIMPDTGIVITTDIGDATDIHPRNKREVGRRLALWALHDVYEIPITSWSSPTYREISKTRLSDRPELMSAIVTFDHTEGGLKTRDGRDVSGFAIAGEDGIFHWAEAKIYPPNKVHVWSEKVPDPVSICYAWQNNPDSSNLINASGLPADGFQTDIP